MGSLTRPALVTGRTAMPGTGLTAGPTGYEKMTRVAAIRCETPTATIVTATIVTT